MREGRHYGRPYRIPAQRHARYRSRYRKGIDPGYARQVSRRRQPAETGHVEDAAADDRRRASCAVRAGRAADHSGRAAAELTQVAALAPSLRAHILFKPDGQYSRAFTTT